MTPDPFQQAEATPSPNLRRRTAWALAGLLLAGLASGRSDDPASDPSDPPDETGASPSAIESGATPAPLPPPGEMARCKALIDAGAYWAARQRLEPIVAVHPRWARATALLGLTYYRENRFDRAEELFARALAIDPGETAVRPVYGWTLYSLGELGEAEAIFDSLVERLPRYAPAHYALGLIHLDRDELEAARAELERAAELAQEIGDEPMEGRARARLGDLHVRLGELEEAQRALERALELFPQEREALFKLSRVLQRLGDAEGAAEARHRFEAMEETPGRAVE